MINIWDCDQMPSEVLKEGGRYVVSPACYLQGMTC